jgi:hypothetical protein
MAYRDVREKMVEGRDSGGACQRCNAPVDSKTLTDFGAMCFPCFAAYCREPFVYRQRSRKSEEIRSEIAAMRR